MKKGFSKKSISTSLVEIYYSNTYKENGCFSCEKGIHGNTDLRIYGTIMVPVERLAIIWVFLGCADKPEAEYVC